MHQGCIIHGIIHAATGIMYYTVFVSIKYQGRGTIHQLWKVMWTHVWTTQAGTQGITVAPGDGPRSRGACHLRDHRRGVRRGRHHLAVSLCISVRDMSGRSRAAPRQQRVRCVYNSPPSNATPTQHQQPPSPPFWHASLRPLKLRCHGRRGRYRLAASLRISV